MSRPRHVWPLLTAVHHYDKSFSTRGRGKGTLIRAPVLAYLVETSDGRVLVDVGCDYQKLTDPALLARFFDKPEAPLPAPSMTPEQRIPSYLERLGLTPADIDAVVLTHLHFDHAGGLADFRHADVHVHARELAAAYEPADGAYFADETANVAPTFVHLAEFSVCPGITALETPGHTAGHVSVFIELEQSRPILLAGDAADLLENLEEEIAPGLCHKDDPEPAIESIRKLKRIAHSEGAFLWPSHDWHFFETLKRFPSSYP